MEGRIIRNVLHGRLRRRADGTEYDPTWGVVSVSTDAIYFLERPNTAVLRVTGPPGFYRVDFVRPHGRATVALGEATSVRELEALLDRLVARRCRARLAREQLPSAAELFDDDDAFFLDERREGCDHIDDAAERCRFDRRQLATGNGELRGIDDGREDLQRPRWFRPLARSRARRAREEVRTG